MIHTFKSCGIQAAIDSRDGSVLLLDSLMYAMLPALPEIGEMTKDLPTSIRYAFAKYDSQDLNRAYRELYNLFVTEKEEIHPESVGKYILVSAISEETLKTLPAGSTVISSVTCSEYAEWLIQTFPSLTFRFAADENVCKTLENSTVIFEFTNTAELLETVSRLFGNGMKSIAGYPKAGVSESEAIESYEKLCRELVRMRKKGETGIFVPFAFESSNGALAVVDGETVARYCQGTFSAVYMESGMLPLNAAFLYSDALIDKCAECAVVLSAK